jgi:hypothetical protein
LVPKSSTNPFDKGYTLMLRAEMLELEVLDRRRKISAYATLPITLWRQTWNSHTLSKGWPRSTESRARAWRRWSSAVTFWDGAPGQAHSSGIILVSIHHARAMEAAAHLVSAYSHQGTHSEAETLCWRIGEGSRGGYPNSIYQR